MARDNFTKAVIEKLQKRVANRCSNPDCRVPTVGPSSNSGKATSIGIAAHITAASLSGPRYETSLTEKQRKSLENGIWLCSNCSIAIDKDVDRHPVELLKKWKQEAEELARQEMGRKLPDKKDAVDILTAALTGKTNRLIVDAIQNTHKASVMALEALDPRFSITSAYANGTTHFEMHAKENVPLTLNVKDQRASEYVDKYRELIDHGTDLAIDGISITIEGSKLLEELTSNSPNGNLKLVPIKHKATQKIWLLNKKTSVIENFDDIQGHISVGRQAFTFSGMACNEVLNLTYLKSIDKEKPVATMNVRIDFEKWTNVDVRSLPYFSKLYSLFEKINNGWFFFTSLEINGIELMKSKEATINTSFPKEIFGQLTIIKMARTIASSLNIKIPFNPRYSFSDQEFSDFHDTVSIVDGTFVYYKKDIRENMKGTLVVENDNIAQLRKMKEPLDFTIAASSKSELQLFGQLIALPPIVIRVKAATPHITSTKKLDDLTEGDKVNIEWIPSDEFEYRIEFEKAIN